MQANARVILRCVDLDRAVQFWRDAVGLELIRRSHGFAFFAAGSTELLVSEVPPDQMVPSLTEVVFAVDDVHDTHRRLAERGVPFEVEPRPVMTEGNRRLLAAHFRDPDGNLIEIIDLRVRYPLLRHLGWFAALGVGYAFVFTILVMPVALSMVKSPWSTPPVSE